nr:uncharacterized protein LOC129273258 [Lytechinus pictus]
MAAYYAGLHKRLKDNSVPICDRVKLARFGWVSNQCFLPNKHQVLLDWVSFRLVNSEKYVFASFNFFLDISTLLTSVRSLLFSRNMAEAYKMYLMSDEGDKKKKDGRVWADVVDKFLAFLRSKAGQDGVLCGLPIIYSAFLTSFRPTPDLTFAMLQKLCSLMSFKSDDDDDEDTAWDHKVSTLEELLKLATSHKCYAVVEEETERAKKMEWFKKIVSHLMADKRLHPSWFGCLDIVFSLDHSILASRMQEVWPCLLATNVSIAALKVIHDNESNVTESRDAFLKSVMETYMKLRQVDKMTKVLLSSILTKKEFSSSIQLPASFLTSFSTVVESLTPGSTVALWDIIMSDITTNHLPAVLNHMTLSNIDPPPAKKKKKPIQMASGNNDAVARFEVAASILHTFLVNSRMADAVEVGQVKGQVLKLFDKMADDVLKPLLGIFSSENQSLAFSTLLLCHGWGELHLLLRQHTNIMERISLPTFSTPMKNGEVHFLHTYSSAPDWLKVMSPSAGGGNEKLCFLKNQLLWQQARGLVLHGNLEESVVTMSLRNCICQALDLDVEQSESNSASWDGLISHMKNSNIYTALLTSLLHQSLTLLTFMNERMHSSLASLLCQAVCGSSQSEDDASECSIHTARHAALGFLDSEACRESRPMQNAVVEVVADRLKELNQTIEVGDTGRSKTEKGAHSKQKKQSITQLHHSQGNQISPGDDVFKTGFNLIKILRHLPLVHLSAGNQLKCMLGLVMLDTRTVSCIETGSPVGSLPPCDLVELSTDIRRILTTILKGVQGDEVLRNTELNLWFFSYLTELAGLLSQEDSRLVTSPEYKKVSKDLIALWLKKATWSGGSLQMFDKYLKWFHQHIVRCLKKLKSSKKSVSPPGVFTMLSIAVTLLNQSVLACKHKTADAESKEILVLITDVRSSVFQLLSQILSSLNSQNSSHQLKDVFMSARTLLASADSTKKPNRHGKENKGNEPSENTSDQCDQDISGSQHFTTCHQRALSIFSAKLQSDDSDDALMTSCLEYLASHCSITRKPLESKTIWTQLHSCLPIVSRKCHSSVRQQLEGLLIITLGVMETDDLTSELQQMLKNMELGDSNANVIGILEAWQLLPGSVLSDESFMVVMEMVPKVLDRCQKLLHETIKMQSQPTDGTMVVAILTTVAKFISQGKVCYRFTIAFNIHLSKIGFKVLGHFSLTILQSHVLSALIERCSLRTIETMRVDEEQLVTCAENMQRLLSLIASLKSDISQYGIYLIADYINGLQKTTLPSQVKTPLVGGIYKIVDVCDDKTLSLLNVTLPVSLKEVFRSFYADYKKHHKYTGHV